MEWLSTTITLKGKWRLRERAAHGVEDRPLAVPDRDDDAGLDRKVSPPRGNRLEARRQQRADPAEVLRREALHVHLVVAVPRVDVVELLFARRPRLPRGSPLERLGDPDEGRRSERRSRRS